MKKLLAVIFVGIMLISGCGNSKVSKLDEIKKAGKIVMYTNAEFPPYEFVQDDEIVGVDIEIGKAIAEKIGVELEIMNADFDGIVASIATGKGDVGISGITINEERKGQVDFSVPYVDSVQYVILPEDSELKVVEDFAELALGGQTGTTGSMLIEDEIADGVLAGTKAEFKSYKSAPTAMQDLITGRIAGVVIDELVAISIADANEGYKAIPLIYKSGSPVTEQFGVAIKKENEDLLKIIDEAISSMLSDGSVEKYLDEYSAIAQE
ncbi:transporter substrate-binding domain-containing protein [Lachnospiraceae bacterium ZAX-1]